MDAVTLDGDVGRLHDGNGVHDEPRHLDPAPVDVVRLAVAHVHVVVFDPDVVAIFGQEDRCIGAGDEVAVDRVVDDLHVDGVGHEHRAVDSAPGDPVVLRVVPLGGRGDRAARNAERLLVGISELIPPEVQDAVLDDNLDHLGLDRLGIDRGRDDVGEVRVLDAHIGHVDERDPIACAHIEGAIAHHDALRATDRAGFPTARTVAAQP